MPSFLALPAWLLRKLPARLRIVATSALALLAVGLVILVVLVALPAAGRRSSAQQQRERRQLLARLADVRRIQRPHVVILPARDIRSPQLVERALETRIAAAAHTRRASCRRAAAPPLSFTCEAIQSANTLSVISIPFTGHVALRTGRAAFCRSVPPPDVPTEEERAAYRIPRLCGGGPA